MNRFLIFPLVFLMLNVVTVRLQSYDYVYDEKKFLDGIKEEENYESVEEESSSPALNINPNSLEIKSPADIYVEYEPKNLPEKLNLTKLRLKAYALHKNKQIIEDKDVSKYGQLKWMTYGYIRLVQIKKTPTSISTEYFEFTRDYISIQVEMLTDEQKLLFVDKIKEKYNVEVKSEQIQNLVLKNLECITHFKDELRNNRSFGIVGRVENLDRFPLRIDFKAREGTRERRILEEKIKQASNKDSLNLRFDCEFVLDEKTDKQIEPDQILQINSEQLSKDGLLERLFGKSNLVYVMYEQMIQLASELYTQLNILNDFRVNEGEFVDLFLEGLLKQTSTKDVQFIDLNGLNELSTYGLENKNNQPNHLIKSQLSNLFSVKEDSATKQQRIVSSNFLDQLNIFSIFKENVDLKGAINKFREENDSNKNLSLEQQLMKLNSITSNHIEWNLDSSTIVDPKKVKVFRLEKSKFLKNPLVLEKLKNKKNSSLARQIVKRFGLFTIKTTEFCSPKETLNLVKEKHEQYNKNQELKVKIIEMKQILDDYKDEVAKNFLPANNDSKSDANNDSKSDANMSSNFVITSTSSSSEFEPYKNTLTFRGHIDRVTTLEFDEKNKRIISSSAAFNIKIWDIISGKCLHTFYNVHNDSINVMKLFYSGKYLVTGSDDRTMKILSLDEEEWLNNPYTIRKPGRVLALAVYEEKTVISGTDLNEINVINDDGDIVTLWGHEGHVNALSINQKTNQLISAASDGTIKFWKLGSWENLRTIKAHQNSIKSLILNQDGEFLFSYSKAKQNNEIKVWNLAKGINSMGNLTKFESNKMLQCIIINEYDVTSNGTFNFAINNNNELLTAPYSKPLKIWNYETGANLNTFNLDVDDKSEISKLIITKNNKIIVGYESGIIRVWV